MLSFKGLAFNLAAEDIGSLVGTELLRSTYSEKHSNVLNRSCLGQVCPWLLFQSFQLKIPIPNF